MRPWLSAIFCPPLPEITPILLWGKAGTEACAPRRRAPGLVVGWEVAKAHYLSLPRVLCGTPPPSRQLVPGPRVLGVSAPCVEGSSADYLCPGPAPLQCSLSWSGVSRTGRGLLKGEGGTDFSPEIWLPPRLLSCQVVVLAAYSPPFNPPYLIRKRSMRKVLSGTGQTGQLGKGCQLSFYSYTLGNSSLSIWETLYRAFSC